MKDWAYLRTLLALAGVRPRQLLLAVLAGAVTLLSALTLTVLSGWLITRAWEMPPVLDLSVAITAVRALGISRSVFRYIDRLVSHRLALSALTTLRSRLFNAIVSGGGTGGVAHLRSRGEGLSRLVSDADRVTDLIVRTLVPGGVALVLSLTAVILAGALHPGAAVIMVVGFLFTGVVTPWLAARAARHRRHIDAQDELAARIDESLRNRAEVEAAGVAGEHAERTRRASARFSRAEAEAERPEALGDAVHSWATGLTAAGVLVLAVLTYPGEPVWLGMLVMLPLAAFEAHGQLAKAAVRAELAAISARRLVDLVDGHDGAAPEPVDAAPLRLEDTHLRASGLRCRYGEIPWDLDLAPGERMVVRGPSGCGKTTLLQTLGGLLPPRAGELTLGGRVLTDVGQDVLRSTIRVHAEDEWVFATTIRENVKVGNSRATGELVAECLAAVGLDDWVNGLSEGMDTVLADGAGSLSSGQRRRLLLARALVSESPVLLIDEPTEHIDADGAAELLDMLLNRRLPGGRADRSVILVTHQSPDDAGVEVDKVSVDKRPAPVA
ncbi:thiol reductant ABC exporter subunit CydC [Corynebacterium guangdongense]|uniref:ATP-binding cassette subfamily C protein CydC n=1 Tax=Corynebacterium guangdongense TaxID=1783348 RepID=A0ABU1ZZ42_9CORY|nr:thiol reductant ABC exporter subunit CydC [Corynebacterium guangdongense]MDR7330212.1 ATP-binding cassette subfamily C protein CydC [Corynebacterium guangdongense]WJZ18770.1 putative ABC transporter ATP-binding protein [Corynebacterium guangdongense]